MKYWQSLLEAKQELTHLKQETLLTIGNFDGVHLGHQEVIRQTVALAKKNKLLPLGLTFRNHPAELLGEERLLISPAKVRRRLLAAYQLAGLLEVGFDPELAELTPETFFYQWVKEGLRARGLVIGHDFRFGRHGRGNFEMLRRLCRHEKMLIKQIPPLRAAGEVISSSRIRRLLQKGEVKAGARLLGRPFFWEGRVIRGQQLARKLGYKTANLLPPDNALLPLFGVYLIRAFVADKPYFGVANLGMRPTFDFKNPLLEVHLFNLDFFFYDQIICVEFLEYIREERVFANLELLKEQIATDVAVAQKLAKEYT